MRLPIGPLTVNELEPLVPLVKVRPVIAPSVRVPLAAETVIESEPLAPRSVTLISLPKAEEKSRAVFTVVVPVDGPLTVGRAFTLSVTAAFDDLPFARFVSVSASPSEPEKLAVGW